MNWKSLFRRSVIAIPHQTTSGAFLLRVGTGAGEQRLQACRLRFDQPELAQVVVQVFQQVDAPLTRCFLDVLGEYALQVATVGLHRLIIDPLNFHQLVVNAIVEAVIQIEHVGETAGHAGTEVVAGLAQYADKTAGHVFAAMVASAFHYGVRTGVTHGETLARSTGGEQLAAGHALADVVVGVAFQVQVQTTGVPHTEALARSALEAEGDRRLGHALVAMFAGDFAGDTGTNGTVAVADFQIKLGTAGSIDRRLGQLDHLLGQQAFVERRVALNQAELRLVGRNVVAAEQRRQVQMTLLGGFARQHFQQIGTPDQLFQATYAQLGQPLAGFFGDIGEEVHHHFDGADEVILAQLVVLRGHAGGAVVQVTDAQVFAAQGDHRRSTKTEAFGTENGSLDHVEAGFQAAVGLYPYLAAQVVAAQGLVGFGQAEFPRRTGVLDRDL